MLMKGLAFETKWKVEPMRQVREYGTLNNALYNSSETSMYSRQCIGSHYVNQEDEGMNFLQLCR